MKALVLLFLLSPSLLVASEQRSPEETLAEFHRLSKSSQALIARDEDKFDFDGSTHVSKISNYFSIGDMGQVVAPGTFSKKLDAEGLAALEKYQSLNQAIIRNSPSSPDNFNRMLDQMNKGEPFSREEYFSRRPRFAAQVKFNEREISKEEYTSLCEKMDAEIRRDREAQARLLLSCPELIQVLTYENFLDRWSCDAAVKVALELLRRDSSVSSR